MENKLKENQEETIFPPFQAPSLFKSFNHYSLCASIILVFGDAELNKKKDTNSALVFLTSLSRSCCCSLVYGVGDLMEWQQQWKKWKGFTSSSHPLPPHTSTPNLPTIKMIHSALLPDLPLTQLSSDSVSHFQKLTIT